MLIMCSSNSNSTTDYLADIFNQSSSLDCNNNSTFSSGVPNSTNHRLSVEKFVSPITVLVLTVISLAGNGMLFSAIRASKIFRRPVNLMLGNLAMASIISTFGGVSMYGLKYASPRIPPYMSWVCRLLPVLGRFPQPAETYSVLCISMDRCRVVKNPWKIETSIGARKKIIFTWIAAFLVELPRALFHDCYDESDSTEFQCYNSRQLWGKHEPYIVYMLLYALLVYWIPSLLLLRGKKNGKQELAKLLYAFTSVLTTPCGVYMKMITEEDLICIHAGQKNIACRNAFLFIFIFILIQLPIGTWYSVYELPVSVVPTSVRTVAVLLRPWLLFVYFTHYSLYPLLVFALSPQIRSYYRNMILCQSSV